MKLKKLLLKDDFRSLKSGFELIFDNDDIAENKFNAYCIVGKNGSGKSNILELCKTDFELSFQLEFEMSNWLA